MWLGVKVPQLGVLEPRATGVHVATQSTPAPAGSLMTVAETLTLLPVSMEVGGGCVYLMEMNGVCVWGAGIVWLLLHPVMTPRAVKLQDMDRNAPIQRSRRPFRLVLPQCAGTLAAKPARANACQLPLRCGSFIGDSMFFMKWFNSPCANQLGPGPCPCWSRRKRSLSRRTV